MATQFDSQAQNNKTILEDIWKKKKGLWSTFNGLTFSSKIIINSKYLLYFVWKKIFFCRITTDSVVMFWSLNFEHILKWNCLFWFWLKFFLTVYTRISISTKHILYPFVLWLSWNSFQQKVYSISFRRSFVQ